MIASSSAGVLVSRGRFGVGVMVTLYGITRPRLQMIRGPRRAKEGVGDGEGVEMKLDLFWRCPAVAGSPRESIEIAHGLASTIIDRSHAVYEGKL